MRAFTVHVPPVALAPPGGPSSVPPVGEAPPAPPSPPVRKPRRRPPELVREGGFAWLAFLFPTPWFLANRMWLVALGHAAIVILVAALTPEGLAGWVLLALQLLVGLHARDLRRWTLSRRGYRLAHVVVARDEEAAFARLLQHRPDLARAAAA